MRVDITEDYVIAWQQWFAWHPIILTGNDGREYLIWLQMVERKLHRYQELYRWDYREVEVTT